MYLICMCIVNIYMYNVGLIRWSFVCIYECIRTYMYVYVYMYNIVCMPGGVLMWVCCSCCRIRRGRQLCPWGNTSRRMSHCSSGTSRYSHTTPPSTASPLLLCPRLALYPTLLTPDYMQDTLICVTMYMYIHCIYTVYVCIAPLQLSKRVEMLQSDLDSPVSKRKKKVQHLYTVHVHTNNYTLHVQCMCAFIPTMYM